MLSSNPGPCLVDANSLTKNVFSHCPVSQGQAHPSLRTTDLTEIPRKAQEIHLPSHAFCVCVLSAGERPFDNLTPSGRGKAVDIAVRI